MTLAWTAVAGATAYVVAHDFLVDAAGKGEWHSLTQHGTTTTVAELATAARFRVQARNAAGLSLPVAVTPGTPWPNTPRDGQMHARSHG